MVLRRFTQSRLAFALLISAICSVAVVAEFAPSTKVRAYEYQGSPPVEVAWETLDLSKAVQSVFEPSAIETRAGKSYFLQFFFDNAPFWKAIKIILSMNFLGWLVTMETKSQLHVDILGTGAFVAAALPTLFGGAGTELRVRISSMAVVVWGAKLAYFLLFRLMKQGHDMRLVDLMSNMRGTTTFWVMSAIWGIVCSLPHTLGSTSYDPGSNSSMLIGSGMYIAGLAIETLADYQKLIFKQSYPGQFCNVGLWSISQHPNFFGDMLLWAGILVMNLPALKEPVPPNASLSSKIMSYRRVALALVSPCFMWKQFYRQAGGIFASAAELAATKYGNDPNYWDYINSVPLVIPNPFRK